MVLVPKAKGYILADDQDIVDPNIGITIFGRGGTQGQVKYSLTISVSKPLFT